MRLSLKTTIKLTDNQSNLINHMCYSAYKLWNVCNYERKNYDASSGEEFPNWYYQKKAHKDDLWFKQLPSQTAQEVCKVLEKSWKSYFKLLKIGNQDNPHPPRYKQEPIHITYMQNGIVHDKDTGTVRLTLSKNFKEFMLREYGIDDQFIALKNKAFKSIEVVQSNKRFSNSFKNFDDFNIKQIKLYPPKDNIVDVIIVYEIPDIELKEDNGNYLSIDMGVHNFMTCYDSTNGETFIVGRKYLSIARCYLKGIARIQSQWADIQVAKGVKYPKMSKHAKKLYEKKNNCINDYLHKITRYVVNYCKLHNINTLVIGDITGIRKDKDFHQDSSNQNFHGLPYKKLSMMLEYKCALEGIHFVKQKEAYSSQVSPLQPSVDKQHATKDKRVRRGLYMDSDSYKNYVWNADCVGAFNILRLYLQSIESDIILNPIKIKIPRTINVAV